MYFMISDGGPHSAEKWAHVGAQEIMKLVQIAPSAPKEAFKAYRELEERIYYTLLKAHGDMQDEERRYLSADSARLHEPAMAERAAQTWAPVVASQANEDGAGLFEAHFKRLDVQEHIYRVLGQHFADSIHIERCWHADRNPDNPHAQAFNLKRLGR